MLKLAVVQMSCEPCQVQTNAEAILMHLEGAAQAGAKLLLFPECVLTGYDLSPEEAARVAVHRDHPVIQQLSAACKRLGVFVQIGAIEVAEKGELHNSVFLMGPDGTLETYHKTHMPLLGADRFLTPGELAPGVVDTLFGSIGSLICYDLRFPEPARLLALGGAQVILVSTAWPRAAHLYTDFLAQTRAAENRVFLAAANRCASERSTQFLGRSLIINPEGTILQEAGPDHPEILYAEIDVTESRQKKLVFEADQYELDLFADRRPELYQALTTR
jgi:predicted amidohydrolase